MPRAKIRERLIAHNERWLAKTGSWLLVAGATIGTFQGLVVMGFGDVALVFLAIEVSLDGSFCRSRRFSQ